MEAAVEISVSWRIPGLEIVFGFGASGDRQERVAVYPWIARLVEGVYLDLQVLVLAQYLLGVLVGVERIHQYQWDVGFVRLVQVLNKRVSGYPNAKGD